MIRFRPTAFLAAALFLIVGGCGGHSARPEDRRVHIILLHINDVHGQVLPRKVTGAEGENPVELGGLATIAEYVRRVREEAGKQEAHVVLVDAGDFFQGTPEGDLLQGKLSIQAYNRMKFDALALGNHEFDQGAAVIVALARRAKFPLLAANMAWKVGGPHGANPFEPAADLKILGAPAPESFRAAAIIRCGPVRIGLVGLITSEMPSLTTRSVRNECDFHPEAETLRKILPKVRVAGADVIIPVTHVGVETDRRLARGFARSDFPLVVGGHSHTLLPEGERDAETGIVIVQAGARGEHVGRVDLIIDSKTHETTIDKVQVVRMDREKIGADPELERELTEGVADLNARMGKPIGKSEGDFPQGRGTHEGRSAALGNWLTDRMAEATGVPVALHNRTGIRASLGRGVLTERDLYLVSPFANTLMVVELTGSQLRGAIEYALTEPRRFLDVSGVRCRYDPARPAGERIVELTVGEKSLGDDETIAVVTNSFIADGGDGHVTFAAGRLVREVPRTLFEITLDWVRTHAPLRPDTTERIAVYMPPPGSGEPGIPGPPGTGESK